jgi:hypothetical protein
MRPRTEINRWKYDFELVSGNRKVKEVVLIRKEVKQKALWGRKGGSQSLGRKVQSMKIGRLRGERELMINADANSYVSCKSFNRYQIWS